MRRPLLAALIAAATALVPPQRPRAAATRLAPRADAFPEPGDGKKRSPAALLLASAVPPVEPIVAPAAANPAGPGLLSWANAPYLAGAAFTGYRAYKAYVGVRDNQVKLIDKYGKDLKLGKKQSRAQFASTTKTYKRKLMYLPRGPALFASGLAAISSKTASVASLQAFRDLVAVHGVSSGAAVAAAVQKSVPATSSRGKALFYATRCGLESAQLASLAAEGLDGSAEFLAATQSNLAEQAYVAALGEGPPFVVNAAVGADLGIDAETQARILDGLNVDPAEVDDREDWRKELEDQVEAESGPIDDSDVDLTDKFAKEGDPGVKQEMTLTCECTECGYTLFIAAGREGKFFGDDYKCPECGCNKSKFNIDAVADGA